MSFTGQLGTPNSQLGNIELGVGASVATPSGPVSVSASDLGVGVDSVSTTTSVPASSSGVGNDVVAVSSGAVLVNTSDLGVGTDLVSIASAQSFVTSDFGFALDTISVLDSTPICYAVSGVLEEPQLRIGPEVFLPHWMPANSTNTGLLFQLCQYIAEGEYQFSTQAGRDIDGKYLQDAPTLQPLYEWTVNFIPPADRELTITFQANTASGVVNGVARRAISWFDYDTAVDPVWYQERISTKPIIRLRNLFMHTIQQYTTGSVYTICGANTAAYLGVVPDIGYYYRRSTKNKWSWVSPESNEFSPQSVILPDTGTWIIAYGSNADLASLLVNGAATISYLGGSTRSLPLTLSPVRNLFDGYGLILGVPRIRYPIESNLNYKNRLVDLTFAPPDTTVEGVIRGVSGRLALVNRVKWDGVSDIVLSGNNITTARVVGVDRYTEVNEVLLPSADDTLFFSIYKNWRQNSIVFIDGLPVSNYTVSGNLVTFTRPVTGTVNAVYSIERFVPVISNGYITSISAGQGMPSGAYNIICTQQINAHTVDLPEYQRSNLLTAAGLPNPLFLNIAQQLTESNPLTFGRARWNKAVWLEQGEQKPKSSNLPLPLDVFTKY